MGGGGCGPTEVLVGDIPGVARVTAGVLGVPPQPPVSAQTDTAVNGDAVEIPIGPPAGLLAFPDGSFYFGDRARQRIGFVSAAGSLTWPIGSGLCAVQGSPDGSATSLCLLQPAGISQDAAGNVVLTDERGHRVYRYIPAEERVEVVLGSGLPGVAPSGSVARTARTFAPADVAVGPDDAVYVAERQNHRIVRIGTDGLLTIAAGTGAQGDSGDGGPAPDALLNLPEGVHWMGDTLYIADSGNHRIRRIIGGTIVTYAGVGARGFGGDGGPAVAALFDRPGRMASAGALLFVADRGNHRIRLIQIGPDSIGTFGGTGAAQPGADLLEVGRTALATPSGVAVGGRAVFVADSGGYVVRRVVR
jgi:serine/threonine-protein kinase